MLFALGDENADARIEEIVSEHPNPKTLTVVSSDNRIRLAATRRRAAGRLMAEKFWELIDTLKEGRAQKWDSAGQDNDQGPRGQTAISRRTKLLYWMGVFGELDHTPEMREASARSRRC